MQEDLLRSSETAALTVTQLNTLIHDLLDGCDLLSHISVRGEISNFKKHSSGHLYFSLKDEGGTVAAVMFRAAASRLRFVPENGMRVILTCSVSVYVRGGQYQLYVDDIQPDGVGALYIAFEQLKRRLAAEGLFAPERKRPLPKIPRRIGIVTSPTGAAIHDMIRILGRRFPFAEILLYPALVQGEGAPITLIRGLRCFSQSLPVDLIIIGRGGGSAEDLWAFNDESLARAIAACPVPVISAVGHETDFTICDFVADLRAATPSAAAELAVPETEELKRRFYHVTDKLAALCRERAARGRRLLLSLSSSRALAMPELRLREERQRLDLLYERLQDQTEQRISDLRRARDELALRLRATDPLAVLSRGYAVVSSGNRMVRHTGEISIGDSIELTMADGGILATVNAKKEKRYASREE